MHPADERPFLPRERRAEREESSDERANDQDEDGDDPEGRQQDRAHRGERHRRGDRDEEHADHELDDGGEELTILGHLEPLEVGEGEADGDRSDQPGVVSDGIAHPGGAHHRHHDDLGGDQAAELESRQQQPEHEDRDRRPGESEGHADDEGDEGPQDAGGIGMDEAGVHDGGQDGPDGVDGGALPAQDQAWVPPGSGEAQQGPDDRGAGDHDHHAEHERRPPVDVEEPPGQQRPGGGGHGDTERLEAADHAAHVVSHVPDVQLEPAVEEDHGHREADSRCVGLAECGPQVDVRDEVTGREPDREQDHDAGHADLEREQLARHGQDQRHGHAEDDGVA